MILKNPVLTLPLQTNYLFKHHYKQYSSSLSSISRDSILQWNKKFNGFISVDSKTETFHVCNNTKKNSSIDKLSIAIKDNLWTKDFPTTCASLMLKNFQPKEDATAVKRLRDKGAHIMGKTNMDEFGMGSATAFSYFGSGLNPHPSFQGFKHVPGGSSGGSAAVVKAGSDTGGSVRLPAAYCGIVGFKPSYGSVSRFGLIPYASSLDTIGIFAINTAAINNIFSCIKGVDPLDATSRDFTKPFEATSLKTLSVGIPSEYMLAELHSSVTLAWRDAIKKLRLSGATCKPVSLPHTRSALAAYYLIALSEASSNLARYDGVRFGYRSKHPKSFADLITTVRENGFGPEVQRRILLGTFALTSSAIDIYFRQAQRVRRAVQEDFNSLFSKESGQGLDFLLTPTAIGPAPEVQSEPKILAASYLNDVFTVPASLAGLPSISVPWSSPSEKPVGLQLIAPYGHDDSLLDFAELFEAISPNYSGKTC